MRKRKYPQQDEGIFVPYVQNEQLVVPAFRAEVPIPDRERQDSIKLFRHLHHRVPGGYRDPLSAALVLDQLQRWAPNYYIRAKYMANELNRKQDSLYFDPITIGKLMAELYELAQENFAANPKLIPLVTHTDYKGRLWFINSLPSTYRWFWKIRSQLGFRCQEIMDRQAEGLMAPQIASAWDRLDMTCDDITVENEEPFA